MESDPSVLSDPSEIIPINIKIKQERLTPPPPEKPKITELETVAPESTTDTDKKSIEPIKSSNEILAELFQVFNAAPPKELLTVDGARLKREKSKKKSKDKKHKKRKRDGSPENGDEAKKSKKKIKKEKHLSDDSNGEDHHRKHHKKSKKRKKSKSRDIKKEPEEHKQSSKENSSTETKPVEINVGDSSKSNTTSTSKSKIMIKNLKNSKILENVAETTERKRSTSRKNSSDDSVDLSSDISLSDIEDSYNCSRDRADDGFYNDKRFYDRNNSSRDHYDRSHRRSDSVHRSREHSRHHDYRHHDHYSKGSYRPDDHYHRSSYRSHRSFSRSRSRSAEHEKIDKKRLLEIARKNAITMLKSGTLPGSQYLAPEVKEKALEKMRFGGKTVEELTEYCRKLSNGESLVDLSSVSEDDSDHDKEGNDKAFHHPFVLKERGPIVMNIKNSIPIAPKSAEQTKALLMQYPVSSGQQHRANESEWVPVEPKKPEPVPAVNNPVKKQPVVAQPPQDWVLNNWPKNNPSTPQPVPPVSQTTTTPLPTPTVPCPSLPPPIEPPPPSNLVFPDTSAATGLDIANIISQRLNAMRKLQDNPNDFEAMSLMNNAQKDMTTWVNSKFTPGQFTGSTGANILSVKELSAGKTPWAKRDQLTATTPVSGGMGMHLLQKMGWKPGEGLGKEKNGALIPLLLEVKLDKKGLVANEENRQKQATAAKAVKKQRTVPRKSLENKHPVSLLGELAAKRKWSPPMFEIVNEVGPGHNKNFLFKVSVNGMEYTPNLMAANKKEAKAVAAKFCLQQMGILPS